ncbi:MAG: hypothetical protein ACM3PA_02330 [Methanomassiliicoccales archaeon]
MYFLQNALYAIAAALLVLALFQVIRGDWRRMLHLTADATLFLYVGYVGVGLLPPLPIIAGGAVLVAILLGVSGWLYAYEKQQSNSILAWLGALAVVGATAAYYTGYLK